MPRHRHFSIAVVVAAALGAIAPQSAQCQWVFFGWKLAEHQPNIPNGGRASTLTVNPLNNSHIIVATESGGLFRSTNGGVKWKHIDALQEFFTNAVAFLPHDTSIVIATAAEDLRVVNGGGIWRSTNSGASWTQMAGPPVPAGAQSRLSAFEIAIAPDNGTIYVGTQFGLSISTDNGATWTHADPFGFHQRVISVVAQSGGRVIVGGSPGIRRSDDGGTTWLSTASTPGPVVDMHALGANPNSRDQAYAVNSSTQLYFTENGGNNWTQIASAPGGGGGCGGIAFVKAIGRRTIVSPFSPRPRRSIAIYAGNRCGVSRLIANEILSSNRYDYSGTWTNLSLDHSDTRDLVFNRFRTPMLLGTDGGLHNTTDAGATWKFVGGGVNGFNALQITEVRGQWINSPSAYHLYFGTQDNNLYASSDIGASWKNGICCEGFFIEMLRRVATASDSHINFTTCGACVNLFTDTMFTNVRNWPNATSPAVANPVTLTSTLSIQGVDSGGVFLKGYGSTSNLGVNWARYATMQEAQRDIPKRTASWFLPVAYQAIRTGFDATRNFEIVHLARITRRFLGSGASVTFPLMNNFGGLGINPTMFAWYQVIGVDPGNSRHLIAPDVVNEKMMETWDGGDNWTEIPNLTSMVTDGGNLQFRRWVFPQASAVGFSSDDPNMVAVGTWQGGVFISGDRGATWRKVPGSEAVTYVTSIAWRTPRDAIVSTYGRGLWRITWGLIRPFPDFVRYCRLPCMIRPFVERFDPADPFRFGVLVQGGEIRGARAAGGVLRELFVSPGSAVTFFSDSRKSTDIVVAETRRVIGFTGVKATQTRGQVIVGLAMGEKGNVIGAAYSPRQLAMYEPTDNEQNQDKQEPRRQDSPTAGKPYIELVLPSGAANTVDPGAQITMTGRNLPRVTLEIEVDSVVVSKVRVNEKGDLKFTFRAPLEFGLHRVLVRDAETRKVIDGVMFIVRHNDERPRKR